MVHWQDGSGTITIKEFEKGFQVETTKALFEALGLKAEDAWTLFRSLDKDREPQGYGTRGQYGRIYVRNGQTIFFIVPFVNFLEEFAWVNPH